MSWLAWAIDDPAPADHCGYSLLNVPGELADPSLRRGQVVHSVEGWFTYANPSAVMAARGSSWGVTIMRSGQVWRHRPRPTFVNWHAGRPAQNIGTDGIEMDGKNQPWTPEQKASLLRVLKETWEWFGWADVTLGHPTDRTQESIRQALLACGYGSLWEHRWFDYTSCPSGRNEWGWLISALEEDDMDRATFNKWWLENWGKYIGDVPDGVTEPTGHINRYLRGVYPKLQLNVARAAAKGGVLTKLAAQVNTLEALKNSVGWGTDRKTMGQWFTEWRAAIKALQEAVAELKADSGNGLSADEARAIAQEEDAKLRVTK